MHQVSREIRMFVHCASSRTLLYSFVVLMYTRNIFPDETFDGSKYASHIKGLSVDF